MNINGIIRELFIHGDSSSVGLTQCCIDLIRLSQVCYALEFSSYYPVQPCFIMDTG
jgi:hypothetical protein